MDNVGRLLDKTIRFVFRLFGILPTVAALFMRNAAQATKAVCFTIIFVWAIIAGVIALKDGTPFVVLVVAILIMIVATPPLVMLMAKLDQHVSQPRRSSR